MGFNISRFALTLRKDLSDLRRGILSVAIGSLILIIIADTILLIAYGQMYMSALTELLGSFNVFFILIGATAISSVAFKPLGQKASATSLLMLPASGSEKFLSRWLLAVPCPVALLIGVAYAGDELSSLIVRLVNKVVHHDSFGWSRYISGTIDGLFFISVLLFLQSFFFLGSLLWPRSSWCKSLISLTLLSVVYVVAVIFVVNLFLPASHMNISLTIIGRDEIVVSLLVLTVINYVISYFRFREADIINRM